MSTDILNCFLILKFLPLILDINSNKNINLVVSTECNSRRNHENVGLLVVFKTVVRSKVEENLWKILPEDDVIFNLKPAEGNRLSCLCLCLALVFSDIA